MWARGSSTGHQLRLRRTHHLLSLCHLLAVPMVIVIVSGVAAERVVIFKSVDGIEIPYKTPPFNK